MVSPQPTQIPKAAAPAEGSTSASEFSTSKAQDQNTVVR